MVNLKALEAAIHKIEKIRNLEFDFEVDGIKIYMRPLRPDEETEVQRYAQIALEAVTDEDTDQATFADFMDRMRHASLGFAIVQIDNLNLRDVEYIPTGETNETGQEVSLPKWEAICNLIKFDWTRTMLAQLFAKFGEMLERMELRAQKAVSFEAVDLQEEIERTQRRLTELREAQGNIKQPQASRIPPKQPEKPVPDPEVEVEAVVDQMVQEQPQPQQARQPASQSAPPQPPQGRSSAVPQSAPPRERSPQQDAPEHTLESEEQLQQPQHAHDPEEVDRQGIMRPQGGDSFFDPSDPGRAVEIESRRQAMLHQQSVARQRAQEEQERLRREAGMPSEQEIAAQVAEGQREANRPKAVDLSGPSPGGAVSSLRQAANLQNAVPDTRGGAVRSGRPQRAQPQAAGGGQPAQLHGKPVYKMPTQTLERPEDTRQHGQPAPGPVKMNPTTGARNPNFRGPNK